MKTTHPFEDVKRLVEIPTASQNVLFDQLASIEVDEDTGEVSIYDAEAHINTIVLLKQIIKTFTKQVERLDELTLDYIIKNGQEKTTKKGSLKEIKLPNGFKLQAINKRIFDYSMLESYKKLEFSKVAILDQIKELKSVAETGGTFQGETIAKLTPVLKPELKFLTK